MLKAWSSENLSYDGVYHSYKDIEVLPKPLQDPMPVWMAVPRRDYLGSRAGLFNPDGPALVQAGNPRKMPTYDRLLAENGHSTANLDIPVERMLAIANNEDEARRIAESGGAWVTDSYAKGSVGVGDDPINRYVNDVIIWGTPERVADQLLQFEEEKQLGYLLCAPLSQQTFTLFHEEVLPRIS